MKVLVVLNFILLLFVICYLVYRDYPDHNVFTEISAERLNITDAEGNKYIVLSNPSRQALATLNSKPVDTIKTERDTPGILFFNREGDEIGGLVFDIDSVSNYQLLSFDQRKSDQIMTLRHEEERVDGGWRRRYGLMIQERSDKPVDRIINELHTIESMENAERREAALDKFWADTANLSPTRLFIGRNSDQNVGLYLLNKSNALKTGPICK
ncbi:hypothetical protein [Fulvivirga sediminis]|uniref:Uncharacterized protein n=1 Tax=Fulvivirga sediminis TaxID=2803949 RepID=A0A937FE47_9BACT|nr:hypothetical protein [Fulvivirga sediminis]MBL3659089.1 hypothetical protein [Fulvivirga sediminis]